MNDLTLIIITAVLTCALTLSVPMLKQVLNALIDSIKRVFTRKDQIDMIDVVIIAQLQDRIDELEEQVNNLAKNHYRRETNRKSNIRRDVREYLKELQK